MIERATETIEAMSVLVGLERIGIEKIVIDTTISYVPKLVTGQQRERIVKAVRIRRFKEGSVIQVRVKVEVLIKLWTRIRRNQKLIVARRVISKE